MGTILILGTGGILGHKLWQCLPPYPEVIRTIPKRTGYYNKYAQMSSKVTLLCMGRLWSRYLCVSNLARLVVAVGNWLDIFPLQIWQQASDIDPSMLLLLASCQSGMKAPANCSRRFNILLNTSGSISASWRILRFRILNRRSIVYPFDGDHSPGKIIVWTT